MPLCGGAEQPVARKIVILGDGACGKTSLLNVFTKGYFPQVYEPTIWNRYDHDIFVDGKPMQLQLWDTAGQEEFDRLRSFSYSDTHCIMLCFSVESRDSLENAQTKWVAEIVDHCEGVQLVLVALKVDLRDQQDDEDVAPEGGIISYNEGVAMAKKVNARSYLECSAKTNKGVREAFTEAARVALDAQAKGAAEANDSSSKSCSIA